MIEYFILKILNEEGGYYTVLILSFLLAIGLFLVYQIYKLILERKRDIIIENEDISKKPVKAAVLSSVFPGFGHIYNGENFIGSIYTILSLLACSIIFLVFFLKSSDRIILSFPFVMFFLFLYITGIRDAYFSAKIINEKIKLTKKEREVRILNMIKMGRACYNNKNYEAAIRICTDIISIYPSHRMSYYNRGVIYYKLKNYEKAAKDFLSAAKLGYKEAQKILKSKGFTVIKAAILKALDMGGRRSGLDRRRYSYFNHVPDRRYKQERRSEQDRRIVFDRRSGNDRRPGRVVELKFDDMRIGLDRRQGIERRLVYANVFAK